MRFCKSQCCSPRLPRFAISKIRRSSGSRPHAGGGGEGEGFIPDRTEIRRPQGAHAMTYERSRDIRNNVAASNGASQWRRRLRALQRECIRCNYDVSRRSYARSSSPFSPVFRQRSSRARERASIRESSQPFIIEMRRAALHHTDTYERRTNKRPSDSIYRTVRLRRSREQWICIADRAARQPLSNQRSLAKRGGGKIRDFPREAPSVFYNNHKNNNY